jgi:hypothetical protein
MSHLTINFDANYLHHWYTMTLVLLMLLTGCVLCETRFEYTPPDLCSLNLVNLYEPFISIHEQVILKGYCSTRDGWAFLQQKQVPGYGPYGGVLRNQAQELFATNDSFVLYLQV